MARPVVLVYQEFASVTVTPATPDLNCLVAGPAYWVKDYLDDKGDIQAASDYGTKDTANPYVPPAPATDAITIAEPPGNKIGALLDASSVQVYFDACRVRLAEDNNTPTTGAVVATASPFVPHNKIDCSGCSTAFKNEMVKMAGGDYVIIENPAGGTGLVKRVLLIDATNFFIYTTTNFAAGSASKLKIRVEREVIDVAVDASFIVITGNQVIVQGGVTTLLTGETSPRTVCYAKVYVQYRSLRQDLRALDSVSSETDVTTKIGKNDARNPLAGCCIAALKNTTTPIQFFGVKSDDATGHGECLEVIEGRKDVYATVPLTVDQSILATYKAQYEQLASVSHAETTGIPQKFRVVLGAQTLPVTKVVSPSNAASFADGAHATVDGPVSGTPIVAADDINVFYDATGTFVTAGVRAGDTLVIVDDTIVTRKGVYTIAAVYDNKRLRTTTAFASTNKQSGTTKYYIIRGAGTPVSGTTCIAGVATTGPNLLTADAGVVGLAAHVGKVLRITGGLSPADNGDWLVTTSPVVTPAQWTPIASTQNPPVGAWIATTAVVCGLYAPLVSVPAGTAIVTRRVFRMIQSPTAAFLTDMVIAGDALEIPNPVSATVFTTVFSHTVAYIPNENAVVLAANEDAEATAPDVGDSTLRFRINRALTKDDQVTELVTTAQSFKSRRVVLVWPDSVMINGLVDGSKSRTVPSTPEAADAQPGYYLAAVVGGLTSGLPSHQGFTNLGIAGVDQIYNSTRYFSDTQLTTLSDGGWFLFVQDTPSALPYCLHQLTTDPSTLETGEYSVVKNFDFISVFFQDILDDFLGQYNISEETLGLLNQSLDTGIDLLKLRKYAKIGAPLLSASVTSVAQSTAAADRAELYMEVQMPKPLNRIGLHLISS
jgi:hypothetical protein